MNHILVFLFYSQWFFASVFPLFLFEVVLSLYKADETWLLHDFTHFIFITYLDPRCFASDTTSSEPWFQFSCYLSKSWAMESCYNGTFLVWRSKVFFLPAAAAGTHICLVAMKSNYKSVTEDESRSSRTRRKKEMAKAHEGILRYTKKLTKVGYLVKWQGHGRQKWRSYSLASLRDWSRTNAWWKRYRFSDLSSQVKAWDARPNDQARKTVQVPSE